MGNVQAWISSFLVHQQPRVLHDGSTSEWTEVKSGVPESSILRLPLFNTYVNDIPGKLSSPTGLLQMTAQFIAKSHLVGLCHPPGGCHQALQMVSEVAASAKH